jgi:hypothetical protein
VFATGPDTCVPGSLTCRPLRRLRSVMFLCCDSPVEVRGPDVDVFLALFGPSGAWRRQELALLQRG